MSPKYQITLKRLQQKGFQPIINAEIQVFRSLSIAKEEARKIMNHEGIIAATVNEIIKGEKRIFKLRYELKDGKIEMIAGV